MPKAVGGERLVRQAVMAEEVGLDILGVQDHPYQPSFLDTWTLLPMLAARTTRIRLFPDVINLPLRPPAVLARGAASLDILSGGRVELGLGAGYFWDGILAMGGPDHSPGEAVEAVEEAMVVLRALWAPGDPVVLQGDHYRLDGAQPGPFPPHPIGVWLGAYKRRMLELSGRLADGWVPSSGYAAPEELAGLTKIVDTAAEDAGRDPGDVRRIYNISGRFSSLPSAEFLNGPPAQWAEQLAELTLNHGFSVFIMSADSEYALKTFAAEVAPAVRELVGKERGGVEATAAGMAEAGGVTQSGGVAGTVGMAASSEAGTGGVAEKAKAGAMAGPGSAAGADGVSGAGGVARASGPLDDATRPRLPKRDLAALTATQRANGRRLVQIHDHLRRELAQIRDALEQVAAGQSEAAALRSMINELTMRQNYWTLGSFCASYCRILTAHHSIEDAHMFPALAAADESLAPVVERLEQEHEIVAEILTGLDSALVAMIEDPAGLAQVRDQVDLLSNVLLSHLAYEEEELVEPLSRLDLDI
ncbi:LLM class flavin-dependent oxidoreductase [Acrocarpospora pleiomorpha]|uniref:LLM class flavin-dependent oxidoreductase n=1 Tax=Acrocarpospora pleiomorpha TaxID=90975 RepID=UPI001FECE35F|nr:LLM class flavin-dependent oxidoreductase [Acrocarpospora pleiomorpha]